MNILILGLSGAGKSTIAPILAKEFKLTVYEADDEVMLINGGIWPHDTKIIDKGFAQSIRKVLQLDNVLYVTSWLSNKDFQTFVAKGYQVIELHAQLDELIGRKIKRDNSSEAHIARFRDTYKGYFELIENPEINGKILISIDTTQLTPEQIIEMVLNKLRNRD